MNLSLTNILLIILIVIIFNYIVCLNVNKKNREHFVSSEGVSTVNEALNSISSLYNSSGTLTIPNLHVTGQLTVGGESELIGPVTTTSDVTVGGKINSTGLVTANNGLTIATGLLTANNGATLVSSPAGDVNINTPVLAYRYQHYDGNLVAYQVSNSQPLWSGGVPGGSFGMNSGLTINGAGPGSAYIKFNNLKSTSNGNIGVAQIGSDGNYCVGTTANIAQFGCDSHYVG